VNVRAPRPDDLARVAALIRACDLVDVGQEDTTQDELADEWALPGLDLARDAWIAEEDDEVVAYARVWNREGKRAFLDVYVHPEFRGRGLGSGLLERMEERVREHGVPHLVNFVGERDAAGRILLQSRGYELVRHHVRMEIELDGAPPVPALPDGIALAPFRAGTDDALVHATMNEAFAEEEGHVADSLDAWRGRLIEVPSFDAELWLIAWAGADVAGAAISYRDDGAGWVQGLGVRPSWRGRGLGKALLLATFGAFWERGARRIALAVDSDNPTAARRLYEAVGMRETFRVERYEKRVGA
jgi:mycothiol synthase